MTLLSKVRSSIAADELLAAEEYAGACELALMYARQIDRGVKVGGQDATKALYLGPHLLKTLTELGLTPAKPEPRPVGRPRKSAEQAVDDGDSEEVPVDDLAAARERHRRRRA